MIFSANERKPLGKAVVICKSMGMSIIFRSIFIIMIASFLLNNIVDFMFASSEIFIGACLVYLILNSFTPLYEIIINHFKSSFVHTRNQPSVGNSEMIRDEEMMKLVTYHYGEQDQPREHVFTGKRREKMFPLEPKLNVSSKPNLKGIAVWFICTCSFLSVSFLLNNITYSLISLFNIFAGTYLVHVILCSYTPYCEITAAYFTKPGHVFLNNQQVTENPIAKDDDGQQPFGKNMGFFINTFVNFCSTQVSFFDFSVPNYHDPEKSVDSEGARNLEGRIDEINQDLPNMEENLITENAQDQEHGEQSIDQPELERIEEKIDELPVLLKENKNTEQITTSYGTSVSDSESEGKQYVNPQIVTAPELDVEIEEISQVSITTVTVVETLEVVSSEVTLPTQDEMIKEMPDGNPQVVTAPELDVEVKEISKVSIMKVVETLEIVSPEVTLPTQGEIIKEIPVVIVSAQKEVPEMSVTQVREVGVKEIPLEEVQVITNTEKRFGSAELMTGLVGIQEQNTAQGLEVENGDDATISINLDSDESDSSSVSTVDDHIEVVKSCKPVYEPFTEVHVAPPSELFLNDVITQLDQEIKMIADHEKRAKSVIEEKEKKGQQDHEYEITKKIQYRLMKQIHILDYQKRQYEIQERENIISPETTMVSVPAFTRESKNSQKFAVYIIMVQRKTDDELKSGWILSRRYNEFFELYQYLKKKNLCRFDFPGKTLFTTLDSDHLEFRRAKFNDLLQILISNPKVCSDVGFQKFLHK